MTRKQDELRILSTERTEKMVGAENEITRDRDRQTLVYHDGKTRGGFPLGRTSDSVQVVEDLDALKALGSTPGKLKDGYRFTFYRSGYGQLVARWDASSTATADDVIVIAATGVATGRFIVDDLNKFNDWEIIGDYDADGPLTIESTDQIFSKDGAFYRRGPNLELPYETLDDWPTDSAFFVPIGDAALRQELASTTSSLGAELLGFDKELDTVRSALIARVPTFTLAVAKTLPFSVGAQVRISDRADSLWSVVTDGSEGSPDEYGLVDGNGVDLKLAENRPLPECFGAVGDGVASGGIFSGTDDTGPIQAWLDFSRNYYANPHKVYMCGNLIFPDYNGFTPFLHSDITIAFADCADTSYGLTDYHHLNNDTDVMRGLRGPGKFRLYGNDHVTNAYIGCMYSADARFVVSRCLGAGFVLTTLRANGSTKISGTAVDNRIEIETHDNDGIGFQVIDPDQNKITDGHLHIPVAEGNGGYDFQIEPGAGWQIVVDRNYGSGGGGRIVLGSAATRVHFGQCDSGSASPSGSSGFGLYLDNVITSDSYDQAPGFVVVTGQLNYPVSVGGLSGGTGRRGIDLLGVTFATANGYALLPNTSNPAVSMLVQNCLLSYRGFSTVFGTSGFSLRHAATASKARYYVSNTHAKVASNEYSVGEQYVVDGDGAPKVTPSGGVITIAGAGHWRVEAESGTTDDIDTINGLAPGATATFSLASGGDTITFKDGTGNMNLAGDFALNSGADMISVKQIKEGSLALEVSRSDNA